MNQQDIYVNEVVIYRNGFFLDKNIQYLKRLVIRLHKNKFVWSHDFLSKVTNNHTILSSTLEENYHSVNVMQATCNKYSSGLKS